LSLGFAQALQFLLIPPKPARRSEPVTVKSPEAVNFKTASFGIPFGGSEF
jgi:hypothetical protein